MPMMVSAVQSCGVMPSSMPFWLRNGPAWTHSASTTMKSVESGEHPPVRPQHAAQADAGLRSCGG